MAEVGLNLLDLPRTEKPEFHFLQPDREVGDLFAVSEGVFTPDRDLLWKLDPKTTAYVANRLGLRGWLPKRNKGPHDLRIVCVGDSCTFGFGVHYEESFGVRLERRLQEQMPEFCVESVLAGIVGHSTHQNKVLYLEHMVPLHPDLTVLYCGAWNDYLPSVGLSDAERYGQRDAFRLQKLWSLVWGRRVSASDAQSEESKKAFREGKAPFGRRVPLDEFRANLEVLIGAGRASGGAVVVIVPPLRPRSAEVQSTEAQFPAALEYREVVLDVARKNDLPMVDGPEVFRAYRAQCEEKGVPSGYLFSDWAHPSALGHRVLADALFDTVAGLLERPEEKEQRSVTSQILVSSLDPPRIPALFGGSLELLGEGFNAPGSFDRVWIGGRWISEVHVIDDQRMRLELPALPPGEQSIEVVTSGGLLKLAVRLGIDPPEPPPVKAELTDHAGQLHLDISCQAPSRTLVAMWFATALRDKPAITQYGEFYLKDPATANKDVPPGGTFRFDNMDLPRMVGPSQADGRWVTSYSIDRAQVDGHEQIYVQGLIYDTSDGDLAVVTEAVTVQVPR